MRLLMDCDGVVADWMGAVLEVVEQATGKRPTPEQCAGWLQLKHLGLSSSEKKYVNASLDAPSFVEDLQVLDGAYEGLKHVVSLPGVELAFVTAHWDSPTWFYERKRWLKKHGFLDLQSDVPLVATRHKYLVAPGLLVDDKVSNVISYNEKAQGGRAVLWSTEWNVVDPARKATQIIHSWNELYEEVLRCLKSQK